ncbi:hypothetical protein SADUNF_Sadunf02G0182900 [Salix dunnii]|uniref:Uncharacterized protein n=1 Tax=Salix dunnii TaxID=1413687 RepID=A0A835N8M7_9ROSI|nr:hypothetical protein SADUNF_Sadunf02G0182900 [Salix dunnii]
MENSNNYSSMNKTVAGSKETAVSPAEESGWTSYFEDLSNHEEEDHSLCSSFDSSSMVSDAASFPPWKSSRTNHAVACNSTGALPEKLTFKKTRAKEISLVDDSLEDTASSPGNSPKVSDLRQIDMNPRKTNDRYFNSSLGKIGGSGLEQHAEGLETSERCEMNFSAVKNDCIDLKKRGLCLVPFSMLVNYLG